MQTAYKCTKRYPNPQTNVSLANEYFEHNFGSIDPKLPGAPQYANQTHKNCTNDLIVLRRR